MSPVIARWGPSGVQESPTPYETRTGLARDKGSVRCKGSLAQHVRAVDFAGASHSLLPTPPSPHSLPSLCLSDISRTSPLGVN